MTIDERPEAVTMNLELIGLRVETLTGLVEKDAENVRALARIAEILEHRLTDLEDKN
jgi:hypothetical protein